MIPLSAHLQLAMSAAGTKIAPSNPAVYTLLGVAITAVVSLAALFVKQRLDSKSADRQHVHDLAVLQIQLSEARTLQHLEQTRKAYASLLAGTAEIYGLIVTARRSRRQGLSDDAAYRALLNAIQPNECQVALEEVRLLTADDEVTEAADKLWRHLRSTAVVTGADLSSEGWTAWKNEYWQVRTNLISRLKASMGPHSA